jgi:hypothetical protein
MNQEELVKNWAFEKNLELELYLDSGEWGEAYEISENNVIKITRDYEEFICAYRLLGKNTSYNAKIKEMRVFPTGEMGILLEKVDTEGIEDIFSELLNYAKENDFDILDIEEKGDLSNEAFKMSEDLYKGWKEINNNGYYGMDISGDNIGLNTEGNYVLFDQRDNNNPVFVDYDIYDEIKENLKKQFNIEELNPIIRNNVPLSKILISNSKILNSISNIQEKNNKKEDCIECIYNQDGELQLIKGFDIFTKNLILNNEFINIKITSDERNGIINKNNLTLKKEDVFEINEDKLFSGCELLVDENKLEKCFNEIQQQNSKNIESFLQKKSNNKKTKKLKV